MDTTMEITLEFAEKAFEATACITSDSALNEKRVSFVINNDLNILEVVCNGNIIDYEIPETVKLEFRPLAKKIVIKNEEIIRDITVKYSGSVAYSPENRSCWHNIITNDIKSLSWYSVWFPQETSIEINHDKVIILDGNKYFLVKGTFDETRNVWEYGDKGYDRFNIMAYRKEALKTISSPYMNIYFVDESIKEHAEKSISIYLEVLKFYNGNLFEKKDIPVLDVACASPAITTGGGYRRKDFMWYTTLGSIDEEIARVNAHETAHIWCCGADCFSWEDWLNETTANWASLLFALDRNDTALFDYILNSKLEKYNSLPPIKTLDGSRPDGVHDKGTVLFYDMYKLFGIEAVRKVVRLFSVLEVKTTVSLIQSLYDNKDNDIADFIKEGIMK